MSFLKTIAAGIFGGLIDSLFGLIERKNALNTAIEKDRTEQYIKSQVQGVEAKSIVDTAMKKALTNENVVMSDWN